RWTIWQKTLTTSRVRRKRAGRHDSHLSIFERTCGLSGRRSGPFHACASPALAAEPRAENASASSRSNCPADSCEPLCPDRAHPEEEQWRDRQLRTPLLGSTANEWALPL